MSIKDRLIQYVFRGKNELSPEARKIAEDLDKVRSAGKELSEEDMQDCSIVTAPYDLGNDVQGVIGVIGPTRMSYNKTVPLLEFMAQLLGELHRKD